eukprot:scaffold500_cov178-Alexandrium_tamarense.AAC.11
MPSSLSDFCRVAAFFLSTVSTCRRMCTKTMAARIGESGQPCENPSCTAMSRHVPSVILIRVVPVCS